MSPQRSFSHYPNCAKVQPFFFQTTTIFESERDSNCKSGWKRLGKRCVDAGRADFDSVIGCIFLFRQATMPDSETRDRDLGSVTSKWVSVL